MKKAIFILALLSLTFLASGPSYAECAWTGNVNVFYGIKTIDPDDWSINSSALSLDDEIGDAAASVDQAKEYGLNLDFGMKSWPVGIVVGVAKGSGDDSFSRTADVSLLGNDGTVSGMGKLEVTTLEIRLGVNKAWEVMPNIRPYVAGGIAQIKAEGKISARYGEEVAGLGIGNSDSWSDVQSDSAFGLWFSAGACWTVFNHLNLGIEAGYSRAKVTLGDADLEAGGIHYGMFLGYHF
jgi:hypothetical protein